MRTAAGRGPPWLSGAECEPAPATLGRVLPVTETAWFVEDVLSRVEPPQQLVGWGSFADTDLETPAVVVLENLNDGVIDVHVMGRHHADDGDALGDEGRESTFEPSTAPVGEPVVALPVAALAAPPLGQAVGDHRMQGHRAAVRAP